MNIKRNKYFNELGTWPSNIMANRLEKFHK